MHNSITYGRDSNITPLLLVHDTVMVSTMLICSTIEVGTKS